jgi:hypothetical protein
VANGKLSRAQVWLALASAVVVLLGSGVAISRISEGDNGSPVAASSTSSSLPGLGQPGPAAGSGPSGTVGTGGVAEQAAPAAGEAASDESALVHGVTRSARKAAGNPGPSTSGSSAAAGGGAAGPGAPAAPVPSDGGSQDGGEGPPAPSQAPPDTTPLATAAVSAGEGAQGAVVGIGLGNDKPAEADVTVGTNPLVGDHPPSEGTGIAFGGRFFNPPPTLPTPPG